MAETVNEAILEIKLRDAERRIRELEAIQPPKFTDIDPLTKPLAEIDYPSPIDMRRYMDWHMEAGPHGSWSFTGIAKHPNGGKIQVAKYMDNAQWMTYADIANYLGQLHKTLIRELAGDALAEEKEITP